MLNWNFKDTISYQGETTTQDSRKFEFLVEVYLKKRFPLENWRLTKATRDGNRDLENFCEFSGTSMWAEVKYTIHTDENISSRKYDSTLVSSMFEKNLIKIFFISSTSMGNNLIERIKKFYYLSTVKKIAFVDGYALAYWLKKNPDVETFFFNTPVNYTPPTAPNVQLQCIRILYESDSYTIDSVLEDEVVYKFREDWENQMGLSRELNGLFAVLEICEHDIISICDKFAYENYKCGNWEAMIRNKYRLRFQERGLQAGLEEYLNQNKEIAKRIFRFKREKLIKILWETKLPINYDNIVYVVNFFEAKDATIQKLTPKIVLKKLEKCREDAEN